MKKLSVLILSIICIFSISFNSFALFEKTYKHKCNTCGEVKQCYFIKIGSKKDKEYPCLYYMYVCKDCYNDTKKSKIGKELLKEYSMTITNDGRDMTNDWQDWFYKYVYSENVGIGWGDITDEIPRKLALKDTFEKAYNNLSKFYNKVLTEEEIAEYCNKLILDKYKENKLSDREVYGLTLDAILDNKIEEHLLNNEYFLEYAYKKYNNNKIAKDRDFYKKYAEKYEILQEEKRIKEEEEKKLREKQEAEAKIKKEQDEFSYFLNNMTKFIVNEELYKDKELNLSKLNKLKEDGYTECSFAVFTKKEYEPLKTDIKYTIYKDEFDNREFEAGSETRLKLSNYHIMDPKDRLKRAQDLGEDELKKLFKEQGISEKFINRWIPLFLQAKYFNMELQAQDVYDGLSVPWLICFIEDRMGWSFETEYTPVENKETDNEEEKTEEVETIEKEEKTSECKFFNENDIDKYKNLVKSTIKSYKKQETKMTEKQLSDYCFFNIFRILFLPYNEGITDSLYSNQVEQLIKYLYKNKLPIKLVDKKGKTLIKIKDKSDISKYINENRGYSFGIPGNVGDSENIIWGITIYVLESEDIADYVEFITDDEFNKVSQEYIDDCLKETEKIIKDIFNENELKYYGIPTDK